MGTISVQPWVNFAQFTGEHLNWGIHPLSHTHPCLSDILWVEFLHTSVGSEAVGKQTAVQSPLNDLQRLLQRQDPFHILLLSRLWGSFSIIRWDQMTLYQLFNPTDPKRITSFTSLKQTVSNQCSSLRLCLVFSFFLTLPVSHNRKSFTVSSQTDYAVTSQAVQEGVVVIVPQENTEHCTCIVLAHRRDNTCDEQPRSC